MRKEASLAFLLLACGLLLGLSSPSPANTANNQDQSHETKATIEGLVRDIACPIQNPESTAAHLSMKCLLACAKQGSPLVILTKDGELYLPISNQMPDTDQRSRLKPFLGKYVRATGIVYEGKGMRAIVISEIKEVKGVHLTIEDH
jgi:hypothetical protein